MATHGTTSARAAISRRAVLAGAAAGPLAAVASTARVHAQAAPRVFVCISAAWYGGWSWGRVAGRLRARGHRVHTPSLTGLAERAHLLGPGVNLDTHIADIVNLLRWEDLSGVTLVGHSYGGLVASGVAEKALPALAALVFVEAFLPENGDSMLASASPRFRDAMQAALGKDEAALAPVTAATFGVNPADRAWVDGKTTPHPLASFTQKIALTGARERVVRKAYIRSPGYDQPTLQHLYEAKRKDAAWRTATVDGGHCPMIDAPERLAQLLEELA